MTIKTQSSASTLRDKENRDFRDLVAWQKCRDLRNQVWGLCKSLPKHEDYRLSDQIIRASRSATACIAEGYGRFHYQENIQFCRQARGSLYELIDHMDAALACDYIDTSTAEVTIHQIREAVMVLNGYIKYLGNCKKAANSKTGRNQKSQKIRK
jgi:four helix bundle protein